MSNPDGTRSEPDDVIDVDGTSIVPGPDEPVPGAPEGAPVDPDIVPDDPEPDGPARFAPDMGAGSGDAREVQNPAL
jgi:hypothetical protein